MKVDAAHAHTHHHSLRHAISLCSCLVIFWVFVASFFLLCSFRSWLFGWLHSFTIYRKRLYIVESPLIIHIHSPYHLSPSSWHIFIRYGRVHQYIIGLALFHPSTHHPPPLLLFTPPPPSSSWSSRIDDSTLSYTYTFRSHCLLLLLHLHDITRVNRRT